MHRGMWPGYTFFSFSLAFLAFGPFLKCTDACAPVIFFLVFMRDLKKVIKVNLRSVIQLKYEKTSQEKVFLSSN